MSESLWLDLDAWLVAEFLSVLGAGGSYTDLLIQTAELAMFRETEEFNARADNALVLTGWDVIRRPGPHKDGQTHQYQGYPYSAYVFRHAGLHPDSGNAPDPTTITEVKRIQSRVERALNGFTFPGTLVSTTGETVQRVHLGNSTMGAYRKGQDRSQFTVWSSTDFTIETLT